MHSHPFDYDYIIVGSGFGGSVSALRLAQKGYSVAVLESGKRWHPEEYPRSNWNLKKYLWMPRLGFYGIQRINILKDFCFDKAHHVLGMHPTSKIVRQEEEGGPN